MLEFVIGRAGTGKTTDCLTAMRDKMRHKPIGPALILLLPEHMTYKVERQLAGMMEENGHGFMRAYIFGFRRFAQQVLQETGGAAYPRITDIGKRLLLRKILGRHEKELAVFARAAKQRGFTAELSSSIEEFKSYNIRAAVLADAASALPDKALGRKLTELSMLYEDFSVAMQGRYNDAEDMLDTLADRLPQASLLAGAEVWIDGFMFFNPQEKKIIQILLAQVKNLHITFSLAPEDMRQNEPETGLFHRSWRAMQEIQNLAASLGKEFSIRSLTQAKRFVVAPLETVEQNLFSFYPAMAHTGRQVRVVETATRRLEIESAAADMLRLCREKGYHWHDMGILVRRREDYGNMLELVLADYGIPSFQDVKQPGIHHPLAELLRSAFAVLHGWRYDAVFRCIKTGFFPLVREQAELLENYVLQFGIRGDRWTMDGDWTYHRQASLLEEEGLNAAEEEQLASMNLVRRRVTGPLMRFAGQVKAAADVRAITGAVYDFLETLQVPDTLSQWAAAAEQAGRLAEARQHQQIWNKIMELLEQLVEISGEEKMSSRAYEAILGDGLDALEVSLIPPGLDYVTVASFDQNSLENIKAIYILGANEGVMPCRVQEKGLLSDADRLHLKESGIDLPLGAIENSFSEQYILYKGFTLAREYLWVSYALADAEGGGLAPSALIARLRAILPESEFLSIPLESMERQDGLLLANGRQAITGLAAALRGFRERHVIAPFWQDVYNWILEQPVLLPTFSLVCQGLFAQASEDCLPKELALRLYTQHRKLRGSVTRFEGFQACPFRHFAKYGLRLREREEYRFDAPDLGVLLHATLADFGRQLQKEKRRWRDINREECHTLCTQIVTALAPRLQNEILLSTAQAKNQLLRITKAAENSIQRLIAFDAVSDFQPMAFECSFSSAPSAVMPPLLFAMENGYQLEVSGQIDRIDLYNTHFLIIDYKTGQAAINLLEVYYGLRLQLLTYLLVARNLLMQQEGEAPLPAGMLYCFLKNPILSANHRLSEGEARQLLKKKLQMPGWVLADPAVIREIDHSISFLKLSISAKTGNIMNTKTNRACMKTPQDFAVLLDYISWILADTGKKILDGEIAAQPYRIGEEKACTYCAFQVLCGFDLMVPGYGYRSLVNHEDAELMDTMELKGKGAI